MYLGIHTDTYTHITIIRGGKGHEFKREVFGMI